MSQRELESWVSGFMEFTRESECPDSYLEWAALTVLSAATERHVKALWAYYEVFPNLFVMLVGPRGNRKSAAIRFARDLMRDVKIPIASTSVSREALIDDMKAQGKISGIQSAAIVTGEFSTFIRTSGESMVEFLTHIFDSEVNFEHTTRGSGKALLPFPYVTMLAGVVPVWIANNFTEAFTEEGFASRTIFIKEDKVRFRNARPTITPELWKIRDALVKDLETIQSAKGEFSWTDEAASWFDEWYHNGYDKQKVDYLLEGYHSRKPLHLIKVAMLISLDQSNKLELELPHFLKALSLLEDAEPKMLATFTAVGRNPYASNLERLEALIRERGKMTKGEIIKECYRDIPDKRILDEILENLYLMGKIRINRDGSNVTYLPG